MAKIKRLPRDCMELEKAAVKYAAKNAFEHKGKASTGAVIGKLKALFPEKNIKEISLAAKKAVEETNKLEETELKKKYFEFKQQGFELKPQQKKTGLPELEWAKHEQVITRFAPNPNAPFHLGNARAAVLSAEYAKKYNGKFILRMDDTDPKLKKPIKDAEKIFLEDLNWLGYKPDKIVIASNRLEIYYKYMEKIVNKGKAYICTCKPSEWRNKISKNHACNCRKQSEKKARQLLLKMKEHSLKEGEAVLRIKTDLSHPDPSIRDWWIARIVDAPSHPKIKNWHIWPSYNFASAIDDHELGVTYIIRGQEHEQNKTKQEYLYKYFDWKYPHVNHIGRVKLEGTILSKSKISQGIQEGVYSGYDDVRLGTIKALKRRGIKPKTIVNILLEIGLKSSDTTIQWQHIASTNRKLLTDTKCFPFIKEPLLLRVNFCPEKKIVQNNKEIFLSRGVQTFIVEKNKIKDKQNKILRLKQAYNIKITRVTELQAEAEYVGETKIKNTIPWIAREETLQVIMPDNKVIIGSSTPEVNKYVGRVIQLERFGFVKIEKPGKAVFSHK